MTEFTRTLNQVSQLKVRSVTDALSKYGLLLLMIGVIAITIFYKDWVAIVCFCFAGLFLLLGLGSYFSLIIWPVKKIFDINKT